jgi:hypothetical protein
MSTEWENCMFTRLTTYLRRHHIGLLALCLAMSGTAYAASLPRNSVGTKQLKRNAVTSPKVKNRSLRSVDFARGQLPAGPRGPQGAQGPAGATNVTVRSSQTSPDGTATASCNPGERATGGGGSAPDGYLYESSPSPQGGTPGGWQVKADIGGSPVNVTAFVVCAAP